MLRIPPALPRPRASLARRRARAGYGNLAAPRRMLAGPALTHSRLAPQAPFLPATPAPPVEWRVAPGLTDYAQAVREMEARAEAIAAGEATRAGLAGRASARSTPPAPAPGTAICSTRAFPSIGPDGAGNIPIMGRGSGWPMSCSTSSAAAPTCAPMSPRWKAG